MNKKLLALLLVSAMALQLKAVSSDEDTGTGNATEQKAVISPPASSEDESSEEAIPEHPDGSRQFQGQQGASVEKAQPVEKKKDDGAGMGSAAPQPGRVRVPKNVAATVEARVANSKATPKKDKVRPKHDGGGSHASAFTGPIGGAPADLCDILCHVAQEIDGKETNVVVGIAKRWIGGAFWTSSMKKSDRDTILHAAANGVAGLNQDQMHAFETAMANLKAERSMVGIWGSRLSKWSKVAFWLTVAKVVRDAIKEDIDEDDDEDGE